MKTDYFSVTVTITVSKIIFPLQLQLQIFVRYTYSYSYFSFSVTLNSYSVTVKDRRPNISHTSVMAVFVRKFAEIFEFLEKGRIKCF